MRTLPLLVALLIAAPASAALYPRMTGGEFEVKCRQPAVEVDADGIPLVVQGRSCAIVERGDETLRTVACVSTPETGIAYPLVFRVTATGHRAAFQGVAWEGDDCTGLVSDPADETVYTYPGMSPRKPGLEP